MLTPHIHLRKDRLDDKLSTTLHIAQQEPHDK